MFGLSVNNKDIVSSKTFYVAQQGVLLNSAIGSAPVINGLSPMIFVRPPDGIWVEIQYLTVNATGMTFRVRGPSALYNGYGTPQSVSVEYCLVYPVPDDTLDGWGLRTYNESGILNLDSNFQLFSLDTIFNHSAVGWFTTVGGPPDIRSVVFPARAGAKRYLDMTHTGYVVTRQTDNGPGRTTTSFSRFVTENQIEFSVCTRSGGSDGDPIKKGIAMIGYTV